MKNKIIMIILIIFVLGIGCFLIYHKLFKEDNNKKIDDWEFKATRSNEDYGGVSFNAGKGMTMDAAQGSGNIGFSTGGAKDINNFRENINNGYFPIYTDITYNGLFYDYSFDTGKSKERDELFSPAYSKAISIDPISNEKEIYLSVGLNSNIKESDFRRKKLNLVVVLDISGSMSSPFNSYYYDKFVDREKDKEEQGKSKMQIANESVNLLIDELNDDDRFGMVLFESKAYLGKKISLIGNTDVKALKNHILEIRDMGGTNFEAGYKMATNLYKEYLDIDANEYENRIIIVTDAMPNYGNTSSNSLMSYVKENAKKGIYTSFIGVGVDFNTKLIEEISDVKGANYYSVHSSSAFKKRMGEEFSYMVTPLVFDLELNFKSDNYEIAKVYGSDTVNKDNGSIMKVNTLFPSKTTDGETKGGVILLKLKKKNNNPSDEIELTVSYKDRNQKSFTSTKKVKLEEEDEFYDNLGIRKAILLTRYINVIKNWILYERTEEDKYIILPNRGIIDYDYNAEELRVILGEHERTSVKLTVSKEYKDIFKKIKEYLVKEIDVIKDDNLKQEITLLDKLINQ